MINPFAVIRFYSMDRASVALLLMIHMVNEPAKATRSNRRDASSDLWMNAGKTVLTARETGNATQFITGSSVKPSMAAGISKTIAIAPIVSVVARTLPTLL